MIYVHEIFPSFEGEGPDAGIPTVFVRMQGCQVHCKWCDTPQAMPLQGGLHFADEFEFADAIDRVLADNPGIKRISFTGGDPVRYLREIAKVAVMFKTVKSNLEFHLEHPGFDTVNDFTHRYVTGSLFEFDSICFDYKTLSSGVNYADTPNVSLRKVLHFVREPNSPRNVTIKAVIGSVEDIHDFRSMLGMAFIDEYSKEPYDCVMKLPTILLSPMWDEKQQKFVMLDVIQENLCTCSRFGVLSAFDVRLNVQNHKLLGFA